MALPEWPLRNYLDGLMGEVFISFHVIPQTVLTQTLNVRGQRLKAGHVLHRWVSLSSGYRPQHHSPIQCT